MGIVIGLLTCWPLGVVFAVLSMNEARKAGKPTTLGIVAIIASIVGLVFSGTMFYLAVRG
jgi:hypothetical protein